MPRTRFIKTPDQIARYQRILHDPAFLDIRALGITFLSDPDVIAELIPAPLQPAAEPRVSMGVSLIRRSNCVGAFNGASVNLACTYEGKPGLYCLTMPMSTDTAITFGRELFAEPKKQATIELTERTTPDGNIEARGTVTRHGITYIQLDALFESEPAPMEQSSTTDHYYFKYLPAADGNGLAHDPELIRVQHRGTTFAAARGTGRITLRESPYDPVIDLPVMEVTGAALSVVQTITHAEVVTTVPQAQFLPYAYGKMDDLLLWENDVTPAEIGLTPVSA